MSTIESSQSKGVLPLRAADPGGNEPRTLKQAIWRERWSILVPLVSLLAFTALCYVLPVDMTCSRYYYVNGFYGWYAETWFIENLFYSLSPIPGIVLGAGAIIVLVVGRWSPEIAVRKPVAQFLLLAVLAGPLLLVNTLIKPTIARPRPNQLEEFGGDRPKGVEYVAPWQLSEVNGKSFPSGHASMGFIWMAPAFLFWRRNRLAVAGWLTLGIAFGAAIGFFRVAVGAHFLSDIVWSCGIVYFSGLAVYLLVGGWRDGAFQAQQPDKGNEITAASEAAAQGLQPEAKAA
ncbi:phosphatase PAP2 family protein [Blastopirellula sp. JC732]|uniref:Phosphatase PAP2 family protein n=1 Tax=Blastopirellula sediminis TaxID=2894196 RepID=A0A9X1SGW2_9BACT|nr:phosphatase PAP2 family protein [Blastopirellula sediminis]MCC9607295.1 phosphatase PAP2 family protein [Blastopirellula sediminis]MCC9629412.1 phosphatase PAP2 family protein [Blastopirellula sediminis]